MTSTFSITSLFTSLVPTSTTSTLLDIISGHGTSGGAAEGNPIDALQVAELNQTKDIAATAKQPAVQLDIAAFTKAVKDAKTVQSLLSNPAFQKVFLTANGLGDQIGYTALVTKALSSNPGDSKSLANSLSNTAWESTAKAYNFFSGGLSVIQNASVIATLSSAYAEVTWRTSLDTTTPGLSNALTFRSEASTITSVDQILGDSTMRAVVTTTLGLPLEIAIQPLEAQEKAISSRLDITKFKDPKFVDQFIDQYLIAAGASASSSTSTTSLVQLAAQSQGLTV